MNSFTFVDVFMISGNALDSFRIGAYAESSVNTSTTVSFTINMFMERLGEVPMGV